MLSKAEKDYVIDLLEKGESIPEDFKYKLFPVNHKEYELAYAGKMRREDLLADDDGSFPVPLQIERLFNGPDHPAYDDGWHNMIIFGDNLQFLKTVYKNEDPVIKDTVKGKVKLIYIDPPFATSDDFSSKDGAKAYRDKKEGAEFIEYLRKRIILAHSILSEDGSIFVHLDWKMAHYIKIILDEVFGKNNFRNEIIWAYNGPGSPGMRQFNRKHDTIFWYSKSSKWIFNDDAIRVEHSEKTVDNFKAGLDGSGFIGNSYALNQKGKIPEDWWQMAVASRVKADGYNRMGYPTEKPVKLIERIILACSCEDDIVLDFFAGSGVVASVAEKLNRRWITCDIGKLSYYTVQKRMIEIAKSKSLTNAKKKYQKHARAFMTCSFPKIPYQMGMELDESIAFSFNRTPSVKSSLSCQDDKIVLTVTEFSSEEPRSGKTAEEKTMSGFELLSSVFIDSDYNGREFVMSNVFFSDELKISGNTFTIELSKASVGKKIMVVYTDIFGNDLTECFTLEGGAKCRK